VSDDDSLLAPPRGRLSGPGSGFGATPPWAQPSSDEPRTTDAELLNAFNIDPHLHTLEADFLGTQTAPGGMRPALQGTLEGAHTAPSPRGKSPAFPKPGESIGGFALIGELGRGAFGRVYLAEQSSLGNRLVALKVTKAEGEEPQILARLQHTHIVPIYSLHDDPASGLRLICMPYLGGANLAQVLEAAGARLPVQATGRSLVEALDVVSNKIQAETRISFPSATPHGLRNRLSITAAPRAAAGVTGTGPRSSIFRMAGLSSHRFWLAWPHLGWRRPKIEPDTFEEADFDQPARQFLRGANPIQASIWIIAGLAEGLDHAHSRGLLHRDLKPSNILIASDGMPMLLDFNLSAEVPQHEKGEAGGARALLGGTLPYMAPEHLDAFDPLGKTSSDAVDERSDLYALGLILFEMIAGEHPFEDPPVGLHLLESIRFMRESRMKPPSLRAVASADVPWSIDALTAKCLAPDPDKRYARARDLAEDLRRHLDDLPLKHTPEPSVRERMYKFRRRHPKLTGATSVALMSAVLVLSIFMILGWVTGHLKSTRAQIRYREFERHFEAARFLLNTEVENAIDSHLGHGLLEGEKLLASVGFNPQGKLVEAEWVKRLEKSQLVDLRQRVEELIMAMAQARMRQVFPRGSEGDQREAVTWGVRWLTVAEALDPQPPPTLYAIRSLCYRSLGDPERAASDRERAANTPPISSRDFALKGASLIAEGDLEAAEEALDRAVQIDPSSFWAWFVLGECHFKRGRFELAAGDYSASIGHAHDAFVWPYLNRGLAYANAGYFAKAISSYDQALAQDPRFFEAYFNRALAYIAINDLAHAERDVKRAMELRPHSLNNNLLATLGQILIMQGRRAEGEAMYADLLKEKPSSTMLLTARGVFRVSTDPRGARDDLERVLKVEPRNARAHYGMARLFQRNDPGIALEHANAAIDADPNLLEAWQVRASIRARQGDRAALRDIEQMIRRPTPYALYNAGCLTAVLSAKRPEMKLSNQALDLLKRAIAAGYPAASALSDPDWDSLRQDSEFQKLVSQATPAGLPRNSPPGQP
jgi:serine/threonine protein kinase/tetratricopeptide (TPR) repeat protein